MELTVFDHRSLKKYRMVSLYVGLASLCNSYTSQVHAFKNADDNLIVYPQIFKI